MEDPPAVLDGLYQQALKNKYCDVTVEAQGRTYGAHKGVLVQASPYFEKMFNGHFKESHAQQVSFTEITESVELFEALLKYIYLGKFDASAHDIEDVLKMAHLLLLDKLIASCVQILLKELTVENALYTWALAHMYSLTQLETVCKSFVKYQFRHRIMDQVDTIKLPAPLLCYFIKEGMLTFLSLEEKLIFLQSWLQHATRRRMAGPSLIVEQLQKELENVEPDLCEAVKESDFLSKCLQCAVSDEDPINCVLNIKKTKSSETDKLNIKLCVTDFDKGKVYESSQITVPTDTVRFLSTVGDFVVLKGYEKDVLYSVDTEKNHCSSLLMPTYSFKESGFIFKLGESVLCLLAMPDWAVPTNIENGDIKEEIVETELEQNTHLKERIKNICTELGDILEQFIDDEPKQSSSSEPKASSSTSMASTSSGLSSNHKDTEEEMDHDYILDNVFSMSSPIDLSFAGNARVKHGLFRLEASCSAHNDCPTSSGDQSPKQSCKCSPGWTYITEVKIPHNDPGFVLDKYKRTTIGTNIWIMAKGSVRQINKNLEEEDDSNLEEKVTRNENKTVWLCVQTTDSSDGLSKEHRVVVLPPPPERRTNRSKPVDWSHIDHITLEVSIIFIIGICHVWDLCLVLHGGNCLQEIHKIT